MTKTVKSVSFDFGATDIEAWLDDNCSGLWFNVIGATGVSVFDHYAFEDEADSTLFRIWIGGNNFVKGIVVEYEDGKRYRMEGLFPSEREMKRIVANLPVIVEQLPTHQIIAPVLTGASVKTVYGVPMTIARL